VTARGLGPAELAGAACSVSQAYAALGEIALAEMGLARANDLLAKAGANEAAPARSWLLAAPETLHVARGEQAEAAHARARLLADLPESSRSERLVRAELMMNEALAAQSAGRLAEALRSMEQGIETFAELERDLTNGDLAAALRRRISGESKRGARRKCFWARTDRQRRQCPRFRRATRLGPRSVRQDRKRREAHGVAERVARKSRQRCCRMKC
jgi:tetratricopeptide (TPR) repeat protein